MSLALQGRGVFGFSLGGLGILGRRTLGCPGSRGRVPTTFCLPSSSVSNADSPSELLPHFRQGFSSFCFCERLVDEGCHRTGILGTRFLQPFIRYSEGHGRLAANHRPFSPQPLCPPFSLSHGNLPGGPPFPAPRGLDDFGLSSGRIPPDSSAPGISAVPQVFVMAIRPSDFGFFALAFHPLRKCSPMSWPQSPPLRIVLGIRSSAIWTTGSSSDPPFRRLRGRETSCYGFAES